MKKKIIVIENAVKVKKLSRLQSKHLKGGTKVKKHKPEGD